MLGRYTALCISYELHHEWVNDVVESLLQVFVFETLAYHCKVQVSIAYVTIATCENGISLRSTHVRRSTDKCSGFLHESIVVLRLEAYVIDQAL